MSEKLTSGIMRVEHDKSHPFFVMSRDLAEDATLSYAARGMMCYLLAKPDGWEVRLADLIKQSPGGLRHVRGILKELEATGYLTRTREKLPNGRFSWSTVVSESPSIRFVSVENVPIQNVPIYQVTNGVNTQGVNKKRSGGGELTREARTVGGVLFTPPPRTKVAK